MEASPDYGQELGRDESGIRSQQAAARPVTLETAPTRPPHPAALPRAPGSRTDPAAFWNWRRCPPSPPLASSRPLSPPPPRQTKAQAGPRGVAPAMTWGWRRSVRLRERAVISWATPWRREPGGERSSPQSRCSGGPAPGSTEPAFWAGPLRLGGAGCSSGLLLLKVTAGMHLSYPQLQWENNKTSGSPCVLRTHVS